MPSQKHRQCRPRSLSLFFALALMLSGLGEAQAATTCHDAVCAPAKPLVSQPLTGNPAAAGIPKPLQSLVALGVAHIVHTFPAPDGLQGYLVSQHGQYEVLYGLHGYLLVGGLITPNGVNATQTLYRKYAPKPDVAAVAAAVQRDSEVVHVGHAGPTVIVFFDPNCIFCHKLYESFAPLVRAGRLRVTYVPVGFLKPSSPGKAAAILTAHDPAAALNEDESRFNTGAEEGGITPVKPTPLIAAAFKRHLHEMQQLQSDGTPTLLYQERGGHWAVNMGVPQNMTAFLAGLK